MVSNGKVYVDREQFVSYITAVKQADLSKVRNIEDYRQDLMEMRIADVTLLMGGIVYLMDNKIPISYLIFEDEMYYEFELKHSKFN